VWVLSPFQFRRLGRNSAPSAHRSGEITFPPFPFDSSCKSPPGLSAISVVTRRAAECRARNTCWRASSALKQNRSFHPCFSSAEMPSYSSPQLYSFIIDRGISASSDKRCPDSTAHSPNRAVSWSLFLPPLHVWCSSLFSVVCQHPWAFINSTKQNTRPAHMSPSPSAIFPPEPFPNSSRDHSRLWRFSG